MRRLEPYRGALRGEASVPGDKSISHRVALLAPLAGGACRIRGWLRSADTRASLEAVGLLGASLSLETDELVISGNRFPSSGSYAGRGEKVRIDCGNSGTTARLLCGLLSGRDVLAQLDGDASLRGRPMARVVDPLREMGADIDAAAVEGRLPLEIRGAALRGGAYRLPKASAQIKSALLLAGLCADAPTHLSGCGASRDHSEVLLRAMGADIESDPGDDGSVILRPGRTLRAFDMSVPGDPSSAAFLIAAAVLTPGSEILVPGVCLNPTRTGFLSVLQRMGADVTVDNAHSADGESCGDILARSSALRAFRIAGREVPTLIDELPILSLLAARAQGVSSIRGAGELRVKESDRIATVAAGLRELGIPVEEYPDGLDIEGRPDWGDPKRIAHIATGGDHRLAMTFAVASLVSRGEVELDDDLCIGVSFPGFHASLDHLKE